MKELFEEECVHKFREQYLLFSSADPQRAFDLFVRGDAVTVSDLPNDLVMLLFDHGIALELPNSPDSIVAKIRLFSFCDLLIATDHLWYAEPDFREGMVMPLHPENLFLSRAIPSMSGGSILDIGYGSGVLGLLALARGGATLTGLEVSRRCRRFARFNAMLNRLDLTRCDWLMNDVVSPVQIFNHIENQRFDLIVCNPPFEIGRDEPEASVTLASGGVDGLSYFHEVLPNIASYLTDRGEAHLVFFSVGDSELPQGILDVARRSEGSIEVFWLPNTLETAEFHLWNTGRCRVFPEKQSRLWMGRIVVRRSRMRDIKYRPLPALSEWCDWHLPLHATTPIGYNPHTESWSWRAGG